MTMSIAPKNLKSLTDKSLDFLKSGYLFAANRRREAGLEPHSHTPFTFTMLGKDATVIRGEEAVKFFYDESKISREGAMPAPISDSLFGKGTIHGMDGQPHKVRKQQMADMAYEDSRVEVFKQLVAEEIQKTVQGWASKPGNVYDDIAVAYGLAAFRWAGLPMKEAQMVKRAKQYSHLLDTFGNPAKNVLAQVDRKRLDSYFYKLMGDIRAGKVPVDSDSVAAHIADLRDEKGQLVDLHISAIEIQNLTRPTVAVSRFAAFGAVALVQNPEWAQKLRQAVAANGGSLINLKEAIAFAQEVRRVYPFVPMLPGFVKQDTEISGCPLHKGQRVLMDIVGTHNSPSIWENPADFDPQRFMGIDDWEQITGFLPQGGGEVRSGHRCPGEKIAVAALSATVAALSHESVEISQDQIDTSFPWTKILTRPSTGVRVRVNR